MPPVKRRCHSKGDRVVSKPAFLQSETLAEIVHRYIPRAGCLQVSSRGYAKFRVLSFGFRGDGLGQGKKIGHPGNFFIQPIFLIFLAIVYSEAGFFPAISHFFPGAGWDGCRFAAGQAAGPGSGDSVGAGPGPHGETGEAGSFSGQGAARVPVRDCRLRAMSLGSWGRRPVWVVHWSEARMPNTIPGSS